MSATHDLSGNDPSDALTGPTESTTGTSNPPTEREPKRAESGLAPAFVEAAKTAFERRRELLRRLA